MGYSEALAKRIRKAIEHLSVAEKNKGYTHIKEENLRSKSELDH